MGLHGVGKVGVTPKHLLGQRHRYRGTLGDHLAGNAASHIHHFTLVMGTVEQPGLHAFFGHEDITADDPFHGFLNTHHPRQEPGGTGFRGQPPLGEDKTDLAVGRHQANIHGQGHGDTHPHGSAIDGTDDRFAAVVDGQGHLTTGVTNLLQRRIHPFGVIVAEHIAALFRLHFHAGTEHLAGTGNDHRAHRVILIRLAKGMYQLILHAQGKGVEPVRAIQGNGKNVFIQIGANMLVIHGASIIILSGAVPAPADFEHTAKAGRRTWRAGYD